MPLTLSFFYSFVRPDPCLGGPVAYFSALAAAESPVTLVPTCCGADVGLVYAALSTGYLATGGFVPKAYNF